MNSDHSNQILLLFCFFNYIIILLQCFAVGASNGKVGIFSLANNTNDHEMGGAYGNLVCPVSMFVAHKPQPGNHDDRFGQLGKQLV